MCLSENKEQEKKKVSKFTGVFIRKQKTRKKKQKQKEKKERRTQEERNEKI